MKTMRWMSVLLFGLVSGFLVRPACAATDGTLVNYNTSTANAYQWLNGIKAADGGILSVDGNYSSPSHWVTFSSDMTLGGILCLNRGILSFKSDAITLTMSGDEPTVCEQMPTTHVANDRNFDRRCGWFLPKLVGTGENTLVKDGGVKLMVQQLMENFGEVYVKDGGLVATNRGSVITACPVRLAGFLGYQPNYQCAGGDYAASCAAGGVTVEPGAQISVNKVNADSAALTVGPLARAEGGSLLLRSTRGTSSARALGITEKVLTSGAVPTNKVSGLVAPWIAAREVAEPGTPVHFLGYDAADGFLPFSRYLTDFASSDKDKMVKVSSAMTLSVEASAAAVEVDNANQLVVNARLSLGDGTNPGAIALNSTGTSDQTFEGSGTIDFGEKPGLVWRGASGGVLKVKTKIAGTKGVTFASGGTADSGTEKPDNAYFFTEKPTVELGDANTRLLDGLSGGVHIANCDVRFYRGSFGANDIYLEGGNRFGNATLMYYDYASGSITNHFHVRGDLAFSVTGAKAGNGWTFDAPVTLTGAAVFSPNTQFFQFNQPIDGAGDLTIASGQDVKNINHSRFCAANTYRGATQIKDKGAHWLYENGTFGDGPVTADATSTVVFNGCAGYGMTNDYTCLGSTEIRGATLGFLGKTLSGKTVVSDATTLDVGADVSLGRATVGSAAIRAAASRSRLTICDGSAVAATFTSQDGNSFEIVKTGVGEAVFSRPMLGASTAYGTFRVDEGTVRVESNPLLSPACVLWLDADDDSCVTMDGVNVTAWKSKGAMPHQFKYSTTGSSVFDYLTRTATVNGHRAVTPKSGKSARYDGDHEVSVRTVFIAHRPGAAVDVANLFGSSTSDVGIRSDSSAGKDTHRWQNKIGHTGFKEGDENIYMYVNGEKGSAYTPGETQVVALRVPQGVSDNVRFAPRFLRYYNAAYNGEVGEIIAFDSELTDEEFAFVNDYLMAKWMGKTAAAKIPDGQVLPQNMDVELTTGSVLDLNGTSQTVASLTGKGSIVNTSDQPATLTVSGVFDATVKVGANITVVHREAAKYAVYNDGPVTNGLAYWLDASHAETVKCDENGCVTNWVSRGGSVAGLVNDGKVFYKDTTKISFPDFVAGDATLGGRPSVRFDGQTDGLWSSSAAKARTVFILKCDHDDWTGGGNPAVWGAYDTSASIFFSDANNPSQNLCYPNCHSLAYMQYDDRYRVTKSDGVLVPAAYGNGIKVGGFVGTPYVISLRIDENNVNWTTSIKTRLGAAPDKNGRFQSVGEVLVYERALSDGEMESIEGYLVSKWITAPSIPPENDKVVLTGTVTVPVGEDGRAATVTVEGDLDASAAKLLVTNAKNAPKGVSLTLVDVNGSVAGGFGSTEADNKNFTFSLIGSKYLGKLLVPGLILMVR